MSGPSCEQAAVERSTGRIGQRGEDLVDRDRRAHARGRDQRPLTRRDGRDRSRGRGTPGAATTGSPTRSWSRSGAMRRGGSRGRSTRVVAPSGTTRISTRLASVPSPSSSHHRYTRCSPGARSRRRPVARRPVRPAVPSPPSRTSSSPSSASQPSASQSTSHTSSTPASRSTDRTTSAGCMMCNVLVAIAGGNHLTCNHSLAHQEARMSLVIPTVTEQTPRGERLVDLFSRLLGSRIVFLSTQIDETSANLVVAQLLHLDAEQPGPRHLPVPELPGRRHDRAVRHLRHDDVPALRRRHRVRRPGLLGRGGAARRRRSPASASCCRTPAC